MIISGASGVGKTMFVKNFLENIEHISQKFAIIIFSYSVDQPIYEDF
jgi:GTPase SAR1 family protein